MSLELAFKGLDLLESFEKIEKGLSHRNFSIIGYTIERDSLERKIQADPRIGRVAEFLSEPDNSFVRDLVKYLRDYSYFKRLSRKSDYDIGFLASTGMIGANYNGKYERRGFLEKMAIPVAGAAVISMIELACGSKGPAAPSDPNPSPTPTNYVSFTNALQGLIRNTLVNGKLKLLQADAENGSDVLVDIVNGSIRVNPDQNNPIHRLKVGNYTAVIEPVQGQESFYKRQTPVKVTTAGISVVLGDKDNDGNDREIPLDVIEVDSISGYQLRDYQIGGLRDGKSNRWGSRPEQHVYETLWETTGSGIRRVDRNSVFPDLWNRLMANISSNTSSILDVLNGDPSRQRESDIYYCSAGIYRQNVKRESQQSLPDPNQQNGNKIIYVPLIKPIPGTVIAEGDSANTVNGRMNFASLFYDANQPINAPTFRIDTSRAMGLEPKRGFIVIGGAEGLLLPVVREYVAKILYNRKFEHSSTQENPDVQR